MQEIKELSSILGGSFKLNKHRLECLSMLVLSVLCAHTSNMKRLCFMCDNGSKADSRYRRFQRFFSSCCIDIREVGVFVVNLFFSSTHSFYLALDRTNWKFGSKDINLLVLGAVYQGIALPIWWTVLDKGGNSSTKERKSLISSFLESFNRSRIAGILADREFIGKEWFLFLINLDIPFVIRIKDNTTVTNKGQTVAVRNLFQDLAIGEKRVLTKPRIMWGIPVYLSATRASSGELVILITHNKGTYSLALYARRWGIESMFQCLKGRGFGFEDTRITNTQRISTLMAVLALAFAWAHKTGEWLATEIKPLAIKKHGRPAQSIFRYGLDALKETLFSQITIKNQWDTFLNILKGKVKTKFATIKILIPWN